MKQVSWLLSLFLFVFSFAGGAQDHAFQPGEKVTYNVAYHVVGIYVNAGTASFTTTKESLDNADVYHVVGKGSTNSKYDWIFKVRDRYETFVDADGLQPVKFIRSVSEGKYKKYEEVTFDQRTRIATTKKGAVKVPDNIQDVISSVYYARNINYSNLKHGDVVPFSMLLGNNIYNMHIRYMGKEKVKTKYGEVMAVKLHPLLIKGNAFKGGEDMEVWVTDDNNHIPVKIESKLSVGSIKVDLSEYENLRYPLALLQDSNKNSRRNEAVFEK